MVHLSTLFVDTSRLGRGAQQRFACVLVTCLMTVALTTMLNLTSPAPKPGNRMLH